METIFHRSMFHQLQDYRFAKITIRACHCQSYFDNLSILAVHLTKVSGTRKLLNWLWFIHLRGDPSSPALEGTSSLQPREGVSLWPMADIETPPPPLPSRSSTPAGKKSKQPRHVAFSEVSACSSVPSNYPRKSRLCRKCSCGSCCFACCACSCLVVLALILGILILGVWFVSFIKSALPEVRVQRLSFPGMRIANSSKHEIVLQTGVEVLLNLTNKNEKIGISYSPITAEVYLEDIKTGPAHVSGFSQEPKNQTTLKFTSQLTRTVISKEDGQDLQSDYKDGLMALDMILNGTLGLHIGKLKLKGLPFVIGCNDIKQDDFDTGFMPRCRIRIFAFK